MDDRQKALKAAMELQFEQHPALLRILLDTNDAFLVSCARFSSTEAELNIGMRERDLRLWLSQVRVDSKHMIDLCLRPMAFRPPYLGGNRLGLLLMEVRREFILKGVFPQQLPDLGLSVDVSLGSDSPMENYVPHHPFHVLNPLNYSALWANAFLLMAKQDSTPTDFWTKANSRKNMPQLVSVEEPLIAQVFDEFMGKEKQEEEEKVVAPEVGRAVFLKMANFIRSRAVEDDEVQRLISRKSKESSRMQEIRRAAERSRELTNRDKAPAEAPHQWNPPPSKAAGAISPIRNRSNAPRPFPGSSNAPSKPTPPPDPSPKIPSLLSDLSSASRPPYEHKEQQPPRFGGQNDRRNVGQRFGNNNNNNNNNRRNQQQGGFGQQQQAQRRARSPNSQQNTSPRRSPFQPDQTGSSFHPSNFGKMNDANAPMPASSQTSHQPVAKKPKRVVDESELSEGEILSDDD